MAVEIIIHAKPSYNCKYDGLAIKNNDIVRTDNKEIYNGENSLLSLSDEQLGFIIREGIKGALGYGN